MTATRLLLKGMRAEVILLSILGLALLAVTIRVWFGLSSAGVTTLCITGWLVSPFRDPACSAAIQGWEDLGSGLGSRLLSASGLFPLLAGLVLGVGLVGRELESGTAELTWSLALNRTTWFFKDFARLLVLVVGAMAVLGVVVGAMENERMAGGLWGSTFPDAELYGLPLIARGCLGLAVGSLFGAIFGRALPALLCGGVLVLAITIVASIAQAGFVQVPATQQSDPGYVASYLASPDVEIRFVTVDNQLLTREAALASVPAGVTDRASWLQANYSLLNLGINAATTESWQRTVTGAYLVLGGIAVAAAAWVTTRRRPTA